MSLRHDVDEGRAPGLDQGLDQEPHPDQQQDQDLDPDLAQDLERIDRELDGAPAERIVEWLADAHDGDWCVTTSLTDAVLIDVVTRVVSQPEIVFVDTGFHFPETFEMLDAVEARYGVTITRVRPSAPKISGMYRENPDGCCARHKVEPFERALAEHGAWASGLRRAESPLRADAPVVSRDRRGLVKVNPIATWTDDQVREHIAANDLPEHPLFSKGYQSIGCAPCTAPGSMAREGRWVTSAKTECGLHW